MSRKGGGGWSRRGRRGGAVRCGAMRCGATNAVPGWATNRLVIPLDSGFPAAPAARPRTDAPPVGPSVAPRLLTAVSPGRQRARRAFPPPAGPPPHGTCRPLPTRAAGAGHATRLEKNEKDKKKREEHAEREDGLSVTGRGGGRGTAGSRCTCRPQSCLCATPTPTTPLPPGAAVTAGNRRPWDCGQWATMGLRAAGDDGRAAWTLRRVPATPGARERPVWARGRPRPRSTGGRGRGPAAEPGRCPGPCGRPLEPPRRQSRQR